MRLLKALAASLFLLALASVPAAAVTCSASYPCPAPFQPASPHGTPITAGVATSNVALPSGTGISTVLITNNGAVTAYVRLGVDNTVTATVADIPIPANGGSITLAINQYTYLAAITGSSTAILNINGGVGTANSRLGAVVAAAPSGPAGGDLSGTYPNPTVIHFGATSASSINLNAAALPTAQTGTVLQLAQANAVAPRIELDAYGAASFFTGVRRSGTAASPTQVLAGEQIGGFNAMALDNAATIRGPIASFRVYAGDNITSTTMGSIASIAAIPIGGTALADQLTIYGSTGMGLGLASAATAPAAGFENAKSGAVSFPAELFSGTILTGGTGTTNMPHVLIRPAGTTAATTWSTSGTGLGMNLASGFAGNFLDFRVTGGSSLFAVSSTGTVTAGLWQGSLQSSTTFSSSNIAIANASSATSTGGSIAQTQIGGGGTNSRVIYRGGTASVLTVGNSYGGVIFGDQGITEAASGTHPIIASVAMKSNANTNGVGVTTDSTTLYIEGAPTGITPTNPATALWVAAGTSRFGGQVTGEAKVRANTGFNFNGTDGETVTCTVIPTGLTIQGGIITGHVGGTCS